MIRTIVVYFKICTRISKILVRVPYGTLTQQSMDNDCLMPNEQFFSYIMARTSYIDEKMMYDLY
jgi:hypothetical protein